MTGSSTTPLIAIVGRPNVGKSTLFNRLVGRRQAIVTDQPGVTRDRLYGEVVEDDRRFRLVDTGGLTPGDGAPMAREIERQALAALQEAAVVLFVVDARAGALPLDLELAGLLRRHGLPLVLVANKVDGPKVEHQLHELHELGLGSPIGISAEHGLGIDALLDRVVELVPAATAAEEAEETERPLAVAIVGRPNVGKSSLVNRLLGEERVVVSDEPGTTRDAIDTELEWEGRRYVLVDTAGIRRRGKVRHTVERLSVDRARRNIERADVVILVLDGTSDIAAQDTHIAGYITDAFKPLLVVVNKWDLVEDREQAARRWLDDIRYRFRFAKEAPIAWISAKTGQRVATLLGRVAELWEQAGRWIPTPELNRWVEQIKGLDGSAPAGARGFRLYYGTQTGVHPPTVLLFCNDPEKLHFSLRRHLENRLREALGFGAAPIRLEFRARPK